MVLLNQHLRQEGYISPKTAEISCMVGCFSKRQW
jgi:hypothetical protein